MKHADTIKKRPTSSRPAENSLLRERMRDRSIGLAAPALAGLFEDGNREGVFVVDDHGEGTVSMAIAHYT
jgi:hypothetical protein